MSEAEQINEEFEALADYDGDQSKDELSFQCDDRIFVEYAQQGWFYAKNLESGNQGWVDPQYLTQKAKPEDEIVPTEEADVKEQDPSVEQTSTGTGKWYQVNAIQKGNPEKHLLSLHLEELLELMHPDDSGYWWMRREDESEEGWVDPQFIDEVEVEEVEE
jgi:hypothetical protein